MSKDTEEKTLILMYAIAMRITVTDFALINGPIIGHDFALPLEHCAVVELALEIVP